MKNKALSYLYCIAVSTILVSVVFLTTPVTEHNRGFDSDGRFYAAMADNDLFCSGMTNAAPWCYRVLTPGLAGTLPWSTLDNFRFIAFASSVSSLFILYLLLEKLGFARNTRLFGLMLYAGVFWTLKFSFYSPAYIDHMTQMFLLLILFLTVSRRYLLLIPVLTIASLQKESLAVYSLFAVAHLSGNINGAQSRTRIAAWSAAIILPPAAALLLIRQFIPADAPFDFFMIHNQAGLLLNPRFWPRLALAVFSGLGLIPFIALLRPRSWTGFLSANREWLLLLVTAATFLLGGCDKARLFLYALPFALVLALCAVEDIGGRSGVSPRFVVWTGLTLILHYYMGNHLTPIGTFSDYLTKLVPTYAPDGYLQVLARNTVLTLIWGLFSLRQGCMTR